MLSLGTGVFLAFWMASYNVGLPVGSPPPVRAATSMFLISRANSLPRRASLTAFWCLVVAHLEWPLIGDLYLFFCFLVLESSPDESTCTPAQRAPALAPQHPHCPQNAGRCGPAVTPGGATVTQGGTTVTKAGRQ